MKKNWYVVMIVIALNIVFSGMSGALAQQPPIVGGYAETSNNDPEVVSAARFAIRAEGRRQGARITLLSIERAEQQVVAGINYRLRLRVNVKGQTQNATAVVYQNLQNKYSLSQWDADSNGAGSSGSASANSTIDQLVKTLAEAYTSKSLGSLDAEHPYLGKLKIVIEHSLADDTAKNRFEIKEFKTLGKGEQWLRSRERGDSAPSRETRPLLGCKKGVCAYDFNGGILHNQLYLRKIAYGYRSGRPYIKTIFLLDGD
ncbi:MAG: hypothetical protein QOH63_4006 [Acidobacteriota bacterium]|jgi:cystatin-C|nr:hypothetical protein [Acidobacteriota bacterium]